MDVERQAGDCTKGARLRARWCSPRQGRTLTVGLQRACTRQDVAAARRGARPTAASGVPEGSGDGAAGAGSHRTPGLGRRSGDVAAWRRLGSPQPGRRARGAARRCRCRREVLRTADVYGDGRSEQFIGEFLRERGDTGPPITVATKMTRTTKSSPYRTSRYTGRPGRRRERSTRGGADGRPHLGEVLIEHLEGDVGQQRGEDSSNSVGNWGVFRHPSRCRGCRECRGSCCADWD